MPWPIGLRDMRDRARRLEDESPLASGILDRSVENVIGTGITIRPKTENEEFNKEIGDLWAQWTSGKWADVRRTYGFAEMQELAYRAKKRDGDCGFVLIDRTAEGFRWPELQFIEGDQIEAPPRRPDATAKVYEGIELNAQNAPVAYWVRGVNRHERVDARDFVFMHNTRRYNVARGRSEFHGTYRLFDQLEGHIEAVVVAARIAASQAMIAKRKQPAAALGRLAAQGTVNRAVDNMPVPAKAIEAGMINYIDTDEDLIGFNPTQPHQDFRGFIVTVARFLGLKFGLTVERVLLDFSQANYSVSRSTALQEQKAAEPEQVKFDTSFFARVYPWFVAKMVKLGRVKTAPPPDAWAYEWIPQGRPLVEPSKEAPGLQKLVEMGIEAPEFLATERGYDWKKLLATLKKNKAELAEIGLSLTSGAAQPAGVMDGEPDESSDLEQIRAAVDAFGVGVRAGAITPQLADEEELRRRMNLPAMSESAKAAWQKDQGTRRPITITPAPGTERSGGVNMPDEDEDD